MSIRAKMMIILSSVLSAHRLGMERSQSPGWRGGRGGGRGGFNGSGGGGGRGGGGAPGTALNKFLDRGKVFNGREKKQKQFYENAKKVARFERLMKHEIKAGNVTNGLSLDDVRHCVFH